MKRNTSAVIIIFFCLLFILIVTFFAYRFYKPIAESKGESDTNDKFVLFCDSDDCRQKNLPYQNPTLGADERVTDLIGRMTDAEKIGQMALIEKNSIKDPNDIAKYGLGAMVSGGGGKPTDNTPQGWLTMVTDFQSYAHKTRLGIPLFYGIDAVHGHNNVPGTTIFPHAIGLGASNDPDLVRDIASATADEVSATGINWVYSPNLDVTEDIRWGRTYETFGSNTETVSKLGRAYIEGTQSRNIAAGAKHFIGNGSSNWNSSMNKDFFIDQGNSSLSEAELRKTHLEPFSEAVDAGVRSILLGLNTWNKEKIAFNKYLITDVLKNELGFQGFVSSDWYGVFYKEKDKYQALIKSINAGTDMVMLPYDYKFFSESMHKALANGDISRERIDDAVRRILKAKFETGLFDVSATNPSALDNLRSEENRELARRAVRESLVLLKNENVLPISKNTPRILVAGSVANNIGKQSGGWTVEWQGIDGNWVPGTTILQGIQEAVQSSVEYDLKGDFAKQDRLADIGIAIVGEKPYAEGWGDEENPSLSKEDLEAIDNVKKASQKLVVIIVSGRPLDITEYADDWDAIIAAWLPGSEGQGVADVLFGDYQFTGALPVRWSL